MTKMTVRENLEAVKDFLVDNGANEELVEFIETRIAQDVRAKEAAAKKREGAEKKDAADSEFYTAMRAQLEGVLTGDFKTGFELIAEIGGVTPNGKKMLPAQVATALKPLIADKSVVVGEKVVEKVNAEGLKSQTKQKAYKRNF